ncbi:MAG: hypothetical protein GY850_34855 [bacterium]|nr:hypothetical protein [bacterium]
MQKVLRIIAAVPVRDLARDLARAVDGDMIFFVLFLLLYVWLFLTALQRTQLNFYIRQRLNKFALQVYADKQEQRLGLIWVEIEDDRAARKRIVAAIFARAKALAAQAGVIDGE